MADRDELGRDKFFAKMADAPGDALALIENIQHHFGSRVDAVTYFRNVPDLRLAALWQSNRGRDRKQVFATIQWQPRLLAFRVGAFIQPSVWSTMGFQGANLFTKDPLISYISIPPAAWRGNRRGLISALEAAKRDMLTGV
jgi:hypothetical protein